MIFSFYQILTFFFIYAFIGWCIEVIYAAATTGRLVNRGFLNGPVCPIYGVGMIGVLMLLYPIQGNLFLLFLGGILITTGIELVGGWTLDKMFHMRWWDYSDEPFNFHGYICLKFSIAWGLGVVGVIRIIHPIIEKFVNEVPKTIGMGTLTIFVIVTCIDIIITAKAVIGLKNSLGELEKIADGLKEISDSLTDKMGMATFLVTEKVDESKEKMTDIFEESKEKVASSIAETKERVTLSISESKEKVIDVFEGSKGKVASSISGSKEKVIDVFEGSKGKVASSISGSKEKVIDVFEGSKGKVASSISGSKEKVIDVFEESKGKVTSSISGSKEKVVLTVAEKIEELEHKKAELEKKYEKVLHIFDKQSKRMVKAFPKMHYTNRKETIIEYIKSIRK